MTANTGLSFVETRRPGWLVAKRYGLPTAMLVGATRRRAAGDWLGASVAAGFHVRLDLAEVSRAHGVELAAGVEQDLVHLVPDLVRWHLPRYPFGDSGLFQPNWLVALATYDSGSGSGSGSGSEDPARRLALLVRTGAHLERPQRPELLVETVDLTSHRTERWDGARYLWDARATNGLLRRAGGGDRTPFFDRDGRRRTTAELPKAKPPDDPVALTEWVTLLQDANELERAWAAAGVALDLSKLAGDRARLWDFGWVTPLALWANVPELLDGLPDRLTRDGFPPGATLVLRDPAQTDESTRSVRLIVQSGQTSADLVPRNPTGPVVALPSAWWRRLPELELLRAGELELLNLHPLVRTALFPDLAATDEYRPPSRAVEATTRVRCRGVWHRIGWRKGGIDALAHSPEEAQRERAMRALGGDVPECFRVGLAWQGTLAGLPRGLKDLRTHALRLIAHGDAEGFEQVLDLGVDPSGIRDRWGRGPLHLIARLNAPRLLPRLLGSGLDINDKDKNQCGPLHCVLFDGASAELVRAMLDAGADPTATSYYHGTALHRLRTLDAATILPWLLAAGLDLEQHDGHGRTPLMAQVIADAPVEAIRATLAVGADPTAREGYTDASLVEMLGWLSRDDLDFLVEAAEARQPNEP